MNTLEHTSGDTWQRAWVVSIGETPVDLTGATARLHVRDENNVGLVLAFTTAPGDGLTLTPASGRIDLRAEAAQMALPENKYIFDIELTYSDGRVQTLETAKIKIKKDVSRD